MPLPVIIVVTSVLVIIFVVSWIVNIFEDIGYDKKIQTAHSFMVCIAIMMMSWMTISFKLRPSLTIERLELHYDGTNVFIYDNYQKINMNKYDMNYDKDIHKEIYKFHYDGCSFGIHHGESYRIKLDDLYYDIPCVKENI
jgi:uncharacterized membrane protein